MDAMDEEGVVRSRRTGSWRVGGIEIHRVLENEFWVPEALLRVGDDPAALAARAGWAVPRHAADDGRVHFADAYRGEDV